MQGRSFIIGNNVNKQHVDNNSNALFVGNNEPVLRPEGHVQPGELDLHLDAGVNMPASLFEEINNHTKIGIFFMLYEAPTLFPVNRSNEANSNGTIVGSHIISITVGSGLDFQDLAENITIVFRIINENVRSQKYYYSSQNYLN